MHWIESIPPAKIGLPAKYTSWRPGQADAIGAALDSDKRFVAISAPTGCHPMGHQVLMFNGTCKSVENVVVGDELMGWDSRPRVVLQLCRGTGLMYKVFPTKGEPFIVNSKHLLSVVRTPDGKRWSKGGAVEDVAVERWLSSSKTFQHVRKLFRVGVDFEKHDRLVKGLLPYFLGVCLGDGGLTSGSLEIHKADEEIGQACMEQGTLLGLGVRRLAGGKGFRLSNGPSGGIENIATKLLRQVGVWGLGCRQKFVPSSFLTADMKTRLELLAGLIDTDGSFGGGCYDFISASPQLASDTAFLARSVGLAAYVKSTEKFCQTGAGGTYYRVQISGHVDRIPCRIPRKRAPGRQQKKDALRTSFKVEPVGEEAPYFGFTLSGDGRYLLSDFTVTHNSGKSLIAMAVAKAERKRMVYLTSTKALQDQLMRDFSVCGLKLIKGRNNYTCEGNRSFTCEEYQPACRARLCPEHGTRCAPDCATWGGDCPYRATYKEALLSNLVVTNYSYWVLVNKFAQGLGSVDILVLDEAHASPEELANLMQVTIRPEDLDFLRADPPADPEVPQAWKLWAEGLIKLAVSERWMESYAGAEREGGTLLRHKNRLEKLLQKIGTLATMHGHWVVEQTPDGFQIDPVWPFQHSESWLFKKVPKIILLSATLTHKTLQLLGVSKDKYSFHTFPYVFPRKRAPVFHVKTAAITHKTKPANIQLWLGRIAAVLKRRTDRKGIVHTVSYKRQREIYDYLAERHPDLARLCLLHDSTNTAEVVARYKTTRRICWLLSPSVGTGYDFPAQECEFVLITKLPFPSSQSAVMVARQKEDKQYAAYLMIQELVQSAGRGMRSAEDSCETIIVDDNWFWVSNRYRHLIPDWFRVRTKDSLPGPPATIGEVEDLAGVSGQQAAIGASEADAAQSWRSQDGSDGADPAVPF